MHPVENKEYHERTDPRFEICDFSSSGYPFDEMGPVYLKNYIDPHRQRISLKYAMYALANASDALLEEYPLLKDFTERMGDADLREKCRNGLVELLTVVCQRVQKVCRSCNFRITKIAMTVPAQWTLVFEDLYVDMIEEVFQHPRHDVYFLTETEALAWYLFRDPEYVADLELDKENEAVLFADFGGHNMNGCIFDVNHGIDDAVSFYRLRDPFGAGGGSEQWEFNLAKECRVKSPNQDGTQAMVPMTAEMRQQLLDAFANEKKGLGPGTGLRDLFYVTDSTGNLIEVEAPQDLIDQAWEEAHRRPLNLARDQLRVIAEIEDVKPAIIISGGTSRHRPLQARLKEMCEEAGVPAPNFVDTLEVLYASSKIAKGAAYAVGSALTVEEFFARGAAVGVQTYHDSNNPGKEWTDQVDYLTSPTFGETPKIFRLTSESHRPIRQSIEPPKTALGKPNEPSVGPGCGRIVARPSVNIAGNAFVIGSDAIEITSEVSGHRIEAFKFFRKAFGIARKAPRIARGAFWYLSEAFPTPPGNASPNASKAS
ncbi:hypothetical protein B0T25DRAFT_608255 [Lasiosphaeria hispida]|uniref:Uncharacterized protein n=1 Tax=Lasiosphaeria hispida TaxID=260671 RepID=A0AAJ0MF22_9PEZI|nr:hypothetical protein B0T25DRAFT_608255 [Lasiosphaeria hispida]